MTGREGKGGVVLLALGAGFGVILAATGLLGSGRTPGRGLPAEAAARVNDEIVRVDDYAQATAALANDRRDGAGPAERRHVLERLIDEELLLQRALALDLARRDARVRRDLVAAMVDAVVSEHDGGVPSAAELEAFYLAERDFFARAGRLRVRQVWCRAEGGDERAAEARARQAETRLLTGEPFASVRAALGDDEIAPLPDQLLPPSKLLDYLGPSALQAALGLHAGGVSEPVRSSTGYHVLELVEREAGWLPPLLEIRDEVETEFRRRAGEKALRAYLNDLRSRADIEVRPE
jgi:hypothetical protein